MTGIVLALAGLAAGDGGCDSAPAAAACVDFSGAWEGTWEAHGVVRARLVLNRGKVIIFRDGDCMHGGPPSFRCSLVAEGATTVRVSFDKEVFRGTYRIKGREVRICDDVGLEWVLRRPDPKK
jgi:hypothetical protein